MPDEQLRNLERLAAASGDPAIYQRVFETMARMHGWSQEYIQRMSQTLEIRRALASLPRSMSPSNLHAAIRDMLNALHQRGFGGLGPPSRAYQSLSIEEVRQVVTQLETHRSALRKELAQFIRLARQNPSMAQMLRAGVAAGSVSASVRVVGGQMSKRALLRAAFGAAGRAAMGFLMTPPGLVIAVVGVAVLAVAVVLLTGDEEMSTEEQVAAINCDCANINAGILNRGWIPYCREVEAGLINQVEQGTFSLDIQNGRIAGGSVCDSIAGPEAWPEVGAPATPTNPRPRDTDAVR